MQKIRKHLASSLSISEDELFVEDSPIPFLPAKYSTFYAEKNGSHGHLYHHCILVGDEIFSSAESESFSRLLKKENFLDQRSLNADQFVILFRMLHVKMAGEPLLSETLSREGASKRYAVSVAPPSIDESNGGVRVTFSTYTLRSRSVTRWIVTVSRDYEVSYETHAAP